MPPINVFLAYVDTYIGQHLLKQFENKPALFNVCGCTWEEVAAEALAIQMLERQQQHREANNGPNGARTMTPSFPGKNNGSTADVLINDKESTVSNIDSALPELEELQASYTMATTAKGSRGPLFFWHRDTALMRKALLQCDWIIIEQRQSQDVFDILTYLQQTTFEKPKKLVLLSTFMTWYATPPLSYPEADVEDEDLMDEADEMEDEINAPYPPPPEEKEEKFEEHPDNDEDEDEEPPEGKEILTEDQYNRRIPHAKYFNWRDAEKAVAAAHHAKGLPLDTFVIFTGLPYGSGEFLLEPFFRQAWSMESAALPIYGDGTQCVPMIHVRDLATFTRKLLRCPIEDLPNPQSRYMFATDGASITWRDIMESINRMFGNRMSLKEVPAEDFPLHHHVEFFTIDLRLDNSTIQAIMEREDASGREEGITDGPVLHRDSNGKGQMWIAQGGIKKNSLKIALEFQHHNHVTPLRVALLGPPKAGKTYLSEKIATFYKLPRFSMDEVVEGFKGELVHLQEELSAFREKLISKEKERRLDIKKRRILFANRKEEEEELLDEDEDGPPQRPTGPPPIREESEDDVEEREEKDFALTEEEEKEAEELMEDRFQNSERTNRLRHDIARMERILLMRVRPRPPTPDANPKKRANMTKKKLTKEQQRKKEEDELQQAKEALKDAPFQDRALALMMRWRLEKPDCRAQGYILDGFPPTVELARLCFSSEELPAPETEEEALNPPPLPPRELNEDGEEEDIRTSEPSDEWRLPDHILFLQADENYLLDRLTAVCQMENAESRVESPLLSMRWKQEGISDGLIENSTMNISVNMEEAKALEKFHEGMEVFRQQIFEASYSLFNFFECTVTVAGDVTVGGRRPLANVVTVQETEPLVPPPPPTSEFELVQPSEAEVTIHNILGSPHNFGKTPLEIHQEEVRRQNLEEEKRQKQIKDEHEVREREEQAFLVESELRNKHDIQQLEIKRADYEELEKRKAPLRDYLMKNVIPLVRKGLLEVCATRPEEPVDFLAEWLLRHNPHDDVFCDL